MENILIHVDGMSCEHCVRAVTEAVSALPGVTDVAVDLAAGTVTARHDPARSPASALRAAIEDQGFEARA